MSQSQKENRYDITESEGFHKFEPENKPSTINLLPSNSVNGRAAFVVTKEKKQKIVKIQTNKSADPILGDYIILKKIDQERKKAKNTNGKVDDPLDFLMDINTFFFLPLTEYTNTNTNKNKRDLTINLSQYYENPSKNIYPATMSSANKGCVPLEAFFGKKHRLWLPELEKFYENLKQFADRSEMRGFCHNDLHAGNILYDPSKSKFVLIDYGRCRINQKDFNDRITNDAYELWRSLREEQIKAANIEILEAIEKFPNNGDLLISYMNGVLLDNGGVTFPYDLYMDITGLSKHLGGLDNIYADLAGLSMYIVSVLGYDKEKNELTKDIFGYLNSLNSAFNLKLHEILQKRESFDVLEGCLSEIYTELMLQNIQNTTIQELLGLLNINGDDNAYKSFNIQEFGRYRTFSSTVLWFLMYKLKYVKAFKMLLPDFSASGNSYMYTYGQIWADNYHQLLNRLNPSIQTKKNSPIYEELTKKLNFQVGGGNAGTRTNTRIQNIKKYYSNTPVKMNNNITQSKTTSSPSINTMTDILNEIEQNKKGWEYVYKVKEEMDGKIRQCSCTDCIGKQNKNANSKK